jgi:acetyltransferase-like isoleucine patch superfamily enzyme
MNNAPYIHQTADVQSEHIGAGTRVWQFVVVLPGARIGEHSNICSHCFIESDVVIGDRVTLKSGVQLWDGLRIGNDVFIGPNASFTNDRFPRSQQRPENFLATTLGDGASIGAGAVILPGITIGSKAMVAAGAVVTRSVPPNAIVVGNPAKIVGYVDAAPKSAPAISTSKAAPGVTGSRVRGVNLHQMPKVIDIRGSLSVGEVGREVPFDVKRYFLVYGVPSVETRGEHAHHECHQFLICVSGSCNVVADDGINRQEFVLDRSDLGLHLPPMTWGIQYKYSKDAVLLVLASHGYDASDYIRDYEQFKNLVNT